MRWPTGPFWSQPSALELLKGTPINCLILPWGAAAASRPSAPLISVARRGAVAVVGLLEPKADVASLVSSARAAGLSAVAGAPPLSAGDLPVIAWGSRAAVGRASNANVLVAADSVWPVIKLSSSGALDSADAGPTGAPWIDANGWVVRLLRAMAPDKDVWIAVEPPNGAEFASADPYLLTVAEAATYGARSVVRLGEEFVAALANGDAAATTEWKRLCDALAFFEKHQEWRQYEPAGVLGVLSDFAGENEFVATEVLNLLTRSQVPFRVLTRDQADSTSLRGLKAVVCPDVTLPSPPLQKVLQAFALAGGLLICRRQCAALGGGSQPSPREHPRFEERTLGRGRVAVSKEDGPDPFLLAADSVILLSRRNDPVRLANAGSIISYFSGSADGKRGLLVLLNYARARPITLSGGRARATNAMPAISARVMRPYRAARVWTLEAAAPSAVPIEPRGDAVDLQVPSFVTCAAIELEA